MLSVKYVNPFLASAKQMFSQVCNIETTIGAPTRADICLQGDDLFIMLGVTGEMLGQVFITFSMEQAKTIASNMMMGMPVNEIDDMAKSALSELGNMIMGNAATILFNDNCKIDITPPTLGFGKTQIQSADITSIKVPMTYTGGVIEMYFLLKVNHLNK